MKILLLTMSLMISCAVHAEGNIIEFNLDQSKVVYQLNRNSGSLAGIIKDIPGGICLDRMELTTKTNDGKIFVYEKTFTDRGKSYYQKFDLNLITNQVNIFTSARNRNSTIPIQTRDCSINSCINISNIAPCSY